jgi:hypothetical protein
MFKVHIYEKEQTIYMNTRKNDDETQMVESMKSVGNM